MHLTDIEMGSIYLLVKFYVAYQPYVFKEYTNWKAMLSLIFEKLMLRLA